MVEITQLKNDAEELSKSNSADEEKQKESKEKKRKRNKTPVKVFYVIKAEGNDATEIRQIKKITVLGILAAFIIIILLISTVVLAVMYNVASNSKGEPQMAAAQPEVSTLPTSIASGPLKIISRQEWHSRSPERIPNLLSIPVSMVMISQTVTGNCTNRTSCEEMVQLLQQIDMDNRRLEDIGYNFMVGGDGLVYEGRGWAVEGYHMAGYNNKSIGIALIGTKPSAVQIAACKKLIEFGKENGYIAFNYLLIGASQVMPTLYALLGEIKSWSKIIA